MGETWNHALCAARPEDGVGLYGAICSAEGKGAGLVLPTFNSDAMALHHMSVACSDNAGSIADRTPGAPVTLRVSPVPAEPRGPMKHVRE
jgi:hypothetical protein